jgi:DNA-binding NtrC family response regulator
MIPGSAFALAATEHPLAQAVHGRLEAALAAPGVLYDFETLRPCFHPEAAGVLLLVAGQPADVPAIRYLVQEVNLRQLPVSLLVLVAPGCRNEDFSGLDDYVTRRLRWPEQGDACIDFLRKSQAPPWHSAGTGSPPLTEQVARRLVGHTPSLAPLVEPLSLAASHDVPVLLSGETGTGKTYLARLIHDHSPRRRERFLTVSCGALAHTLIESEFFGHVKGAFTGAEQDKEGKFAAAGDGTLLLDEIDALALEAQSNLLRVLETAEFEPVGSNQTQVCRARIIAASNWNLDEAVAGGKFRQDLYYRLNVMSFQLAPLRDRVRDVAPLVRAFTARYARKFHKELFEISAEAMAALERFPWPGNIRQLENLLQQAVLVSNGPRLLISDLPAAVQTYAPVTADERAGDFTLARNRCEHERRVIQRALINSGNSRTRAAHALGISRVTLYKKMRKYGLLDAPLEPTQV